MGKKFKEVPLPILGRQGTEDTMGILCKGAKSLEPKIADAAKAKKGGVDRFRHSIDGDNN